MDYLYENLGPERFQELCQALLARAFPDTQCFPVAQPDGGRDAITYLQAASPDRPFYVFQVKYVRNPLAQSEPHNWLVESLKEEAPKLRRLIPKGAKGYYLLTNVPGTAHPNAGSIDRARSILAEAVGVPSECWWRNDLNRRLDDAWNLKWAYPEILSGPDVLRLIIHEGLSSDKERRVKALRAFLRAQYIEDEEVRFKQVELQNKLLDLFVDVPVSLREGDREFAVYAEPGGFFLGSHPDANGRLIGAAAFFLAPHIQQDLPQVVLEGAPGQGKSTLAQYLCQVHRMRILEDDAALSKLPDLHRPKAIRLPFRVALRDYATWLSREDPFAADEHAPVPADWNKSIESFLAAQVRNLSGGVEFSVSDLLDVTGPSAVLLVLDGLDEVADIGKRKDVVNEIKAGIARLRENSGSLQVIITSRPAAFTNAPSLPARDFRHFRLGSLAKPLILDYADRWLAARRVYGREAAETKRILRDKLSQAHFGALAQNPMQLAILLSLIHVRGASLPDKRTALYDTYVDIFFNREAEKSALVRAHRDILRDLHGYLAWYLHSEAEKGRNRGSVSSQRLQALLRDYLVAEERDPSLIEALFAGVVERLVFLVSRVEGTYEFEVQPLREYFAARYLYETAPYSPPGAERPSTRPDRFDALSRNFYWLNVTRFFAGCFSKGELPSLIDRLQELAKLDGYRYTNHPRVLAGMLLSDWVFAQHARSTREAVGLVLGGFGLRHVLGGPRRGLRTVGDEEPLVLADQCGRRDLVEECIRVLGAEPRMDLARELVDLLRANTDSEEIMAIWLKKVGETQRRGFLRWLEYGLYLGTLLECSDAALAEVLGDRNVDVDVMKILQEGGRVKYLETVHGAIGQVVDGVLDGVYRAGYRREDLLGLFSGYLDPRQYGAAFRMAAPRPLEEIRRYYYRYGARRETGGTLDESAEPIRSCRAFVSTAENEFKRSAREWATELGPWETVVERGRELFGERWMLRELANVSAGIRSQQATCKDASALFDAGLSLCARARYARLRAGVVRWWEEQARSAAVAEDRMLWALLLGTWGGSATLARLYGALEDVLSNLTIGQWGRLETALRTALINLPGRRSLALNGTRMPAQVSDRLVVVIGLRVREDDALRLFQRYLRTYEGHDEATLAFCERSAWTLAWRRQEPWAEVLRFAARRYAAGRESDDDMYFDGHDEMRAGEMPHEVAQEIAAHPEEYRRSLVQLAAERCRLEIATRLRPLGDIAAREQWFGYEGRPYPPRG